MNWIIAGLGYLRRRFTPAVLQEPGATAVEYAVMVGLIAAVIVGAVIFLGQTTEDNFYRVDDACDDAGAPCS